MPARRPRGNAEAEGGELPAGRAQTNPDGRTVRVWINPTTDHNLDETIVHELLHAAVSPLADFAKELAGRLNSEASTVAYASIHSIEEPIVEQLCRAIVATSSGELALTVEGKPTNEQPER